MQWKRLSFYISNNSVNNRPIFLTSGTQHPEETRGRTVIHLHFPSMAILFEKCQKVIFRQHSTVVSIKRLFFQTCP